MTLAPRLSYVLRVSLRSILASVLGDDGDEQEKRRRHVRVVPREDERIEVYVEGVGFTELLVAQDISEGGIGVIVPKGFNGRDPSAPVKLLIHLPQHGQVRAVATAIHMSSKDCNESNSLFGLAFTKLSDDARGKIAAYVRSRMPRIRTGGSPTR